jgi:hypothetical protein
MRVCERESVWAQVSAVQAFGTAEVVQAFGTEEVLQAFGSRRAEALRYATAPASA